MHLFSKNNRLDYLFPPRPYVNDKLFDDTIKKQGVRPQNLTSVQSGWGEFAIRGVVY